MKTYRGLLAALAVVSALVVAPAAQAALPNSVINGEVPCTAGPSNMLVCSGPAKTFDGVTKVDVNVFVPDNGTTGPSPLIGAFHGWGGAKKGLTTVAAATGVAEPPAYLVQEADAHIQPWVEGGYAVFSMTDRGWGHSCGKYDKDVTESKADCAKGYNHLMDDRYEVHDAQYFMSVLADEEIAQPKKIGVTGGSYGGGISMALAALRNRVMEAPFGQLVPWTSPEEGLEMEIAAAVPQYPWTDIGYALAPNGRNLDYVTESSYGGPKGNFPVGVWKASWNEGLNKAGVEFSNYTEADPEADIPGWLLRLKAGEPYNVGGAQEIITELTTFHSSFYINHSEAPSPLLIQSGWNDDLFPVDEALRFYERTRAQYPGDPISLYFTDIGHQRSQNKTADALAFNQRLEAWLAHYLKGEGATPTSSVETTTTTCPKATPSEGPYRASGWAAIAPGEIRFQSAGTQTIVPHANESTPTQSSSAFEPLLGPGACASIPATEVFGNPTYNLGAAPAGGFTLMGSPTVIANVEAQSPNSEIAARLLDVAPNGTESLIARTLYRPDAGNHDVVFQLHPQGYRFAEGHVARLELLPSDFPYGRYSNLQAPIQVSNLELRLPVVEQPGALGGLVQKPAPKVVPAGYVLSPEFETTESGGGGGGGSTTTTKPTTPVIKLGAGGLSGKLTATRTAIVVPLSCEGDGDCSGQVAFAVKRKGAKAATTVAKNSYSIAKGGTAKVRMPLTKAGRKLVKSLLAGRHPSKTLTGTVVLNDSGRPTSLTSRRAVQLPRAH